MLLPRMGTGVNSAFLYMFIFDPTARVARTKKNTDSQKHTEKNIDT